MEKKVDKKMRRGVYFLSNNKVYDLTIAFLNSFRKFNPEIPLCLIPYDNECDKIIELEKKYKFKIFKNNKTLKACDQISTKFHDRTMGAYRKLAMWDGIFEEFMYIDVDTIVLADINFAFKHLDDFGCFTSHSNIPQIVKHVWKDTIYKSGQLNNSQIAFSANTGFITSKKNFMTFEWILKSIDKALQMKEHMELPCQEQPLLNYLIVTSGKAYNSLFVLFYWGNRKDILLECWAGLKGLKIKNNQYYYSGERVFLLHWAGLGQLISSNLNKEKGTVNGKVPYKKLWEQYRNMILN